MLKWPRYDQFASASLLFSTEFELGMACTEYSSRLPDRYIWCVAPVRAGKCQLRVNAYVSGIGPIGSSILAHLYWLIYNEKSRV